MKKTLLFVLLLLFSQRTYSQVVPDHYVTFSKDEAFKELKDLIVVANFYQKDYLEQDSIFSNRRTYQNFISTQKSLKSLIFFWNRTQMLLNNSLLKNEDYAALKATLNEGILSYNRNLNELNEMSSSPLYFDIDIADYKKHKEACYQAKSNFEQSKFNYSQTENRITFEDYSKAATNYIISLDHALEFANSSSLMTKPDIKNEYLDFVANREQIRKQLITINQSDKYGLRSPDRDKHIYEYSLDGLIKEMQRLTDVKQEFYARFNRKQEESNKYAWIMVEKELLKKFDMVFAYFNDLPVLRPIDKEMMTLFLEGQKNTLANLEEAQNAVTKYYPPETYQSDNRTLHTAPIPQNNDANERVLKTQFEKDKRSFTTKCKTCEGKGKQYRTVYTESGGGYRTTVTYELSGYYRSSKTESIPTQSTAKQVEAGNCNYCGGYGECFELSNIHNDSYLEIIKKYYTYACVYR